jgi:predicted deacylase
MIMPRTLKFRDILIESGEKRKTYMAVTQTPGGQPLGFPLMVVNVAHDGPILLVDGAVRGDEYERGDAIPAIWRDLDPKPLHGSFVGVPVVNVPAFGAGRRASPGDGINMNRAFPGELDGFRTEQLAYRYFNESLLKWDMVVDMHGSGVALAISPTVIYREIGSEALQAKAKEPAFATGVDRLWKGVGKWGAAIDA